MQASLWKWTKSRGQVTTLYHYDLAGQLIAETQADGTPVKDYLWAGSLPVAQVDTDGATDTVSYLHADQLNTPRAASDAAGYVLWRWEGEAFGASAPAAESSIEVNLRFPGQYYDAETGLHYNYFRYYEPETGRYVTSDPIGLDGGLNTYAYVANSPLLRVDPEGLHYYTDGFGNYVPHTQLSCTMSCLQCRPATAVTRYAGSVLP